MWRVELWGPDITCTDRSMIALPVGAAWEPGDSPWAVSVTLTLISKAAEELAS